MASDFDPGAIARIVVRSPNWLGDAVMALPAMAAARRAFPRSTLAVAAPRSVAPLFEEITDAAPDEVLVVEERSEVAALRAGRFDLAILFPNSFRSAWAARRAGIAHRWGARTGGRGLLLTRRAGRPARHRHQAARYLDMAEAFGLSAADPLPRLAVTAGTRQRADALLSGLGIGASMALVGIAPGAAYGHAKRWPPARVAELTVRLAGLGATVVLVGAGADRDAGREIESALPAAARVANLIGRTDLRLLTGVLERCRAFVSNDSGAMHLAAAIGVPVTAIFGPTDERITAPAGATGSQSTHDVILHPVFCRPCMLRDCPIDHRCMKRISVDRVFGAVAARLPQGAPGPT
jgi:heptosyltransferase-2